nr:hypothetical protein [Pseudonocardia sp. AL041005-10]
METHTDVLVVGARCAGSAAAIALARRGRGVVALDGATFPRTRCRRICSSRTTGRSWSGWGPGTGC